MLDIAPHQSLLLLQDHVYYTHDPALLGLWRPRLYIAGADLWVPWTRCPPVPADPSVHSQNSDLTIVNKTDCHSVGKAWILCF